MKKLIRFLISISTPIVFLSTLILATLSLFILNPNYIIKSLNREGVYENIEKATQIAIKQYIREQIEEEGIDLNKLTTGERAAIESQIEIITEPIKKDNIKDFLETNVIRVLGYVNGGAQELILYIPISKWQLPESFLSQLPDEILTENINILDILEQAQSTNISHQQILKIRGYGQNIKLYYFTTFLLGLTFLTLHYKLGEGANRFERSTSLIVITGLLILALTWLMKVASDTVSQGITLKTGPGDIYIATLVPALFKDIIIAWLVIGISLIILSFFMVFGVTNYQKNTSKHKVN